MADTRINALTTTATSTASDDFFPIDGTTNGTRKMSAYNPTYNGTVTFAGSATGGVTKLLERATVSATAATGSLNYDVNTQAVLYYTSNASANWTLNIRGDSGTSLNTVMAVNDSLTVTFLVTQGTTAYYCTAITIDGNSNTPKWQGGTAPTAGNASSVDAYTYTIVKTASATFTVFASQVQFK